MYASEWEDAGQEVSLNDFFKMRYPSMTRTRLYVVGLDPPTSYVNSNQSTLGLLPVPARRQPGGRGRGRDGGQRGHQGDKLTSLHNFNHIPIPSTMDHLDRPFLNITWWQAALTAWKGPLWHVLVAKDAVEMGAAVAAHAGTILDARVVVLTGGRGGAHRVVLWQHDLPLGYVGAAR